MAKRDRNISRIIGKTEVCEDSRDKEIQIAGLWDPFRPSATVVAEPPLATWNGSVPPLFQPNR